MNGLSLTFIKRVLPLKQLATLLILSAFAVTAGIRLYDISSKDVRIIDNGESIVVKTMGATVKEALDSIDIYLQPHDYISMPLNTTLNAEALNVINIKRAVPINVLVDGELREVWSYKDTVEEVIKENKARLIRPPKVKKKEIAYFSEQDTEILIRELAKAPHQEAVMIKLLLLTGMRRGELCGLEWKDIDFDKRTLNIRKIGRASCRERV